MIELLARDWRGGGYFYRFAV